MGINRNIVECKEEEAELRISEVVVLIETLWNVKTQNKAIPRKAGMVLIETLWNVKYVYCPAMRDYFTVLIETLWNVKSGMSINPSGSVSY